VPGTKAAGIARPPVWGGKALCVDDGKVEARARTQSLNDARNMITKCLIVDAANVTRLGGGLGRKSKPDFICEAAFLARETCASL
jgi:isoquinoline 1-oxidoreductase beta subunit